MGRGKEGEGSGHLITMRRARLSADSVVVNVTDGVQPSWLLMGSMQILSHFHDLMSIRALPYEPGAPLNTSFCEALIVPEVHLAAAKKLNGVVAGASALTAR